MDDLLPFEEVYRLYASKVYAYCLVLLRDPNAAEDVASEAFLSAFAAYEKSRPQPDAVRYWLIRIARNSAIDYSRRNSRWMRLMNKLRSNTTEAVVDVETAAALKQDVRDLLTAMGDLTPRQQQLVGLRVAAGLSFDEIAKLTHTSSRAAQMSTFRAMKNLRRARGFDDE